MIGETPGLVTPRRVFGAVCRRRNFLYAVPSVIHPQVGMRPAFKDLLHPATAIGTSFGLGLIRFAPGTFGAAGAFLLFFLVSPLPWAWQAVAAAAAFLLGCAVCGAAARRLGEDDPSAVVWDETAGMLITLVLVPATPLAWVLGFLAFRLLDINKPGPIALAEARLTGGLGIMADDALSGLGAAAIVWACLALIPG